MCPALVALKQYVHGHFHRALEQNIRCQVEIEDIIITCDYLRY